MGESRNTFVTTIDKSSPRISVYEIHEWIYMLRLEEGDVLMLQIDGPARQVYMKLITENVMISVLERTNGRVNYTHTTGEVSILHIMSARIRLGTVRVANLPQETDYVLVLTELKRYGVVCDIRDEMWPEAYRYKMHNGIRIFAVNLVKHIPSQRNMLPL